LLAPHTQSGFKKESHGNPIDVGAQGLRPLIEIKPFNSQVEDFLNDESENYRI
jgi:hypothetical protein